MTHVERLKVKRLHAEDTWKDIVRIPEKHRNDYRGNHVKRGEICCLTSGKLSKWVVVHGVKTDDAVIRMDLNVRLALELEKEQDYDFSLKKLGWLKRLWFPWRASDPIYRSPAQLGLIALILGILSLFIGLVPIWDEHHKPAKHHESEKVAPPTAPTKAPNSTKP
jgi:hypothetical protein